MDARVETLIAEVPRLSKQARLKAERKKMEELLFTIIVAVPYLGGIGFIVSV